MPSDLKSTDVFVGAPPPSSLEAGLAFGGGYVNGAGAISVIVVNNAAGAIDGADLALTVAIVGNESPV